MPRTTIIFGIIAVCLATITGAVWWRMPKTTQVLHAGIVEGSQTKLPPIELPTASPTKEPAVFDTASAILWDTGQQKILFQQNAFTRYPIASLSKLMTAMVALDYGIPWQNTSDIQPDEYGPGTGNLILKPGEKVTVRDLFNASLLGSANNATRAYVRALKIPTADFVQAMNRKAVMLGLEQTHFEEVTGLDPNNVSTAYEVAKMAEYAFSHYPQIREVTSQHEYSFIIGGSGRSHTIRNTNKLIADGIMEFTGSKTGYLDEARYCLVVQGSGALNQRIAVILGSPSEEAHFADIQRLLKIVPL